MIVLGLLIACGPAVEPPIARVAGDWSADEIAILAAMRAPDRAPPDPTDAVADDPGAVRLGQRLFYDGGLSPSGAIACVSCHSPDHAFADDKPFSVGVGTPGRHTPAIVGSQWGKWFFWDGRADSMWSQALGPIENPAEMGGDRMYVARYALAIEGVAYGRVFGGRPDFSDPARFPAHARPGLDAGEQAIAWAAMTDADRDLVDRVFSNVGKALEAYERTLIPEPAPFDRYVDAVVLGTPPGEILSEQQVRGLSYFLRDGNCVACHHGPMLTDRSFHDLGIPEPIKRYDAGRQGGAALVKTGEFNCASAYSDRRDCPDLTYLNASFPDFQAAFKTPSLRNVAITAPYMHTGAFPTIASVLQFYDTLPGDLPDGTHRELTLKALHLGPGQADDLVAFLSSLTSDPMPGEKIGLPPDEPDAPHE